MTLFVTPASDYDHFMGRYSATLVAGLVDEVGVTAGSKALDVGCGPGGLTGELVARLGPASVAAIDPAPQFVAACRERHPGVDVREGIAEDLPWSDGEFDVALSSLVIGFMADADRGLREMARVTRPGGRVAACMWDIATGGMTMLATFWAAARRVDPDAAGESAMVGTKQGDIAQRMRRAGLLDVVDGRIYAHVDYADFDDFWKPFTLRVGPAGQDACTWTVRQPSTPASACRTDARDQRAGPDRYR